MAENGLCDSPSPVRDKVAQCRLSFRLNYGQRVDLSRSLIGQERS
jgi:hypothetical protein